jgi:hypothetical protein
MNIILSFLLCLFLVACEDDYSSVSQYTHSDEPKKEKPNQNQTQASPENNNGVNTFLWKPVGENSKKLVVLIPSRLSSDPIGSVTVNGEVGRYSGNHNGNRAHYRFNYAGSAYGNNVRVILYKNGTTYTWIIPRGHERFSL